MQVCPFQEIHFATQKFVENYLKREEKDKKNVNRLVIAVTKDFIVKLNRHKGQMNFQEEKFE